MKRFFDLCLQIKRSILAFVVTLILGLLSMGALGFALFYPVYPVLTPFFGKPDDWPSGDWFWPAIIGAGMAWSFSFLAAGLLNRRLEQTGWQARYRKAIYVAILWLGAALIWLIILSANISGDGASVIAKPASTQSLPLSTPVHPENCVRPLANH